jgi:hypothetical protein
MDSMTSRERLVAALHGRPVDRLPFSPFLAYVWESYPQAVRDRGQPAFLQEVGADPLWRGAPCPVACSVPGACLEQKEDGDWIVQVTTTPVGSLVHRHKKSANGNTNFLVEHPLKTAEDFKIQLWIEEHTKFTYDPAAAEQHLAGPGREGLSLGMLLPRGKTAFQTMVEYLVGTEELVYALADFPPVVEQLLAVMVAKDLEAVRLAAQSLYDSFITWEDSSTQNYSPYLYDKYIAPQIGQFCQVLAGHGKWYVQHACGHVRALLGSMRAGGVLAVESLSPRPTGNVSIREARQILGSGVGIIGGIEPTRLLNTPLKHLEGYVEQVIAEAAGGPFVLANSDSCPPGVQADKFTLIAQVAKRHRG